MKRHHKISSKILIKYLVTKGYRVWNMNGSHFVLIHENTGDQLQVPTRKELGQKTLNNTLLRAGTSMEEFLEAL